MGLILDNQPGQTALDEDEKEGLLIATISNRSELDEFEQKNIEEAIQWTLGRKLKPSTLFTEAFILQLHHRMYGQVWAWAGSYRKTNKNIGVDKWQIPVAIKSLMMDALFWVNNQTMSPEAIALHFKHRLVCIHCFANGNGRHSRLMADLIISKLYHQTEFSWGSAHPKESELQREQYLQALRAADKGDMRLLMDFAKS